MIEQHRLNTDRRIRMAGDSAIHLLNSVTNALATAVILGLLPVSLAVWMGWL